MSRMRLELTRAAMFRRVLEQKMSERSSDVGSVCLHHQQLVGKQGTRSRNIKAIGS